MRNRTKLIIFLGTPHRGSAYASWGQIASNLARLALQDSNKKILETLEVNNEVLENIHEEFKTIAFKGTMRIHSFQEARGISGMRGLKEKVRSCCSTGRRTEAVQTRLTTTGGRRFLLKARPPARAGDCREHRRKPHAVG
jgi:hypothetical protein